MVVRTCLPSKVIRIRHIQNVVAAYSIARWNATYYNSCQLIFSYYDPESFISRRENIPTCVGPPPD